MTDQNQKNEGLRSPAPSKGLDRASQDLIGEFAAEWKTGARPRVADYLKRRQRGPSGQKQKVSLQFLKQLVLIDLSQRWGEDVARDQAAADPQRTSTGALARQRRSDPIPDRPLVEDYLRQYPVLEKGSHTIGELIVQEIRARRTAGDASRQDEYYERFPELRDVLPGLFNELAADSSLPPGPRSNSASAEDGMDARSIEPAVDPTIAYQSTHLSTAWPEGPLQRSASDSNIDGPEQLTELGDYKQLTPIGRGAMGVVYKAWQSGPNRWVALKLIPDTELVSAEQIDRFEREAESAGLLEHPGIVPVYEFGRVNGRYMLAMAYIEGGDLGRHVEDRPMSPDRAVGLMIKVVEAVAYAHEHGVIHRDLKPSNVLLDGSNQPKVTDFGLAKQMQDERSLTQSGWPLGTPGYMPPEQAIGNLDEVDPVSDVYALGATLYHLLTARPPFRSATELDTLRQVIEQEPIPPRQLNRSIPRDLDNICLKCLQKEKSQRYPTAQALAEDLERFSNNEPVTARPLSAAGRLVRWCRRRPAAAVLVATVLLLSAALVVGGIISASEIRKWQASAQGLQREVDTRQQELDQQALEKVALRNEIDGLKETKQEFEDEFESQELEINSRKQQIVELKTDLTKNTADLVATRRDVKAAKGEVEAAEREVESAEQQTQRELKRAEGYFYLTRVGAAHQAWLGGRMDVLRSFLNSQFRGLQEFQGWEWRYLSNLARADQAILHAGAELLSVAFSPDGRLLAAGDNAGRLWIGDNSSGQWQWLPRPAHDGKETIGVVFSPDGKTLASFGGDGQLWLWSEDRDWKRPEIRPTPDAGSNATEILAVAFSPNAPTRLAYSKTDGSIIILDLEQPQARLRIAAHAKPIDALVFSPDGSILASGSQDPESPAAVWDARTGEPMLKLSATTPVMPEVYAVAFSSDGRLLATAGRDATVRVWNVEGEKEILSLNGHDRAIYHLAFHPHDKSNPDEAGTQPLRLASSSDDGTVVIWDLNQRVKAVSHLRGHDGSVDAAAYNPSGDRVASVSRDGTLKLWDLTRSSEAYGIEVLEGKIRDLRFLGDRNELVCAGSGTNSDLSAGSHVVFWNLDTGEESGHISSAHSGAINAIDVSADGARVATAGDDGSVTIWSSKNSQVVRSLSGHSREVQSVAFLDDKGTKILSGGSGGEVRLWDLRGDRQATNFDDGTDVIKRVLPMPDGKSFITASQYGKITLLDNAGDELLRMQAAEWLRTIAVSPDGRYLASAGESGEILLWSGVPDGNDSQPKIRLPGHGLGVNALVFSPDGRLLASGSDDRTVRIWSLQLDLDEPTAVETLTLTGHRAAVHALAFSHDGHRLASGDGTGIVRVWDGSPLERGQF